MALESRDQLSRGVAAFFLALFKLPATIYMDLGPNNAFGMADLTG